MKIIDTRRTVTGLLGGIATLALTHFVGPLPAVVLVISIYYLIKPSSHQKEQALPFKSKFNFKSPPTHQPPPLP